MYVQKNRFRDIPNLEPGTHVISNTEVATFNACERRHYYAFLLDGGYEPRQFSTALSRGIIGHSALAEFYTTLRETEDLVEAKDSMVKSIHQLAVGLNPDLDMLGKLLFLLKDYADFYGETDLENWEILAVEKYYDIPLTERFKYGMRLDLLVRDRFTGETIVVDHKFVYDFYTANQLLIDAQLPKYIGTVQANGVKVHKGMINQIRHRTRKGAMEMDEKFRREFQVWTINTKEIRNVMKDQVIVSERISDRREMPIEEAENLAVRNIHKMNCDNCAFLQVCKSQLQGESIKLALSAFYQPNHYGYPVEDS